MARHGRRVPGGSDPGGGMFGSGGPFFAVILALALIFFGAIYIYLGTR